MSSGTISERGRQAPTGSTRLAHLDRLRVVLCGGVIVAHAAMTYGAAGTWKYEEPSLSGPVEALLSALIGVGILFGLGLFFLISGLLTASSMRRSGAGAFLRARSWRLGLPVAAYALGVWPALQWWIDRVRGARVSFADSWRAQWAPGERWSAGTGPLWFVAILLVVTVGWSLWRCAAAPRARAGRLVPRHLSIAAAVIAAATFVVRIAFPIDSPQFLDLHVWLWPQSAVLFVVGALGGERGWFDGLSTAVRRRCRVLLLGAVGAMAVMIVLSSGPDAFKGGVHWEAAGFAAVEGVVSVSLSLLVLEWFRRRCSSPSRLAKRLATASYGAFVVQGPVLVGLALALRSTTLSGDVKFAVVAVGALIICFGLALVLPAVRHT